VIQVLGHSPASTRYEARTQGGPARFVGRGTELNLLRRYLDEAMSGRKRQVAIVAPAGVGKTRLSEQFLQSIANLPVRVCRGYCENYLGAEPRQPFVQMLRQLASEGVNSDAGASPPENLPGAVPPELEHALSFSRGSSTGESRTVDEAAQAFCELFAALCRSRPLVLFIDDWQWADDAAKQVVAHMRAAELQSVLVLMTSREWSSAEAGSDDVCVVQLAPFGDDESAQAIQQLRPNADPFNTSQIQRLSGGNPLFIEELCHWTSRDYAEGEFDRGDSLPAWLSTLIESRVARLVPEQADLVRTAAVIGAVIPIWLLEEVTGYGERDAILAELARHDLIFPGEVKGTLRFKHGITRDVAYASVGLRERERLHRQIARLLERRSRESSVHEALLEPLSYHFRAGAEPERAAHYAELAGDKALATAAPDRARSQYAAALAALDGLPPSDENYRRWSSIAHRFGLACVFDPTRDQLALFMRAAQLARERADDAGIARAEYWMGFIHYVLGDPSDAITHYELARAHCARALADAKGRGDPAQIMEMDALGVQLLATIGQARATVGEHDVALQLLDEALTIKRRHRRSVHAAVGSAYALACKGAVLGDLGRFAEAYDCFGEALEAIRAGHAAVEGSILGWQGAVYLWQGRWQAASENALRTQALAQRAGSLYVLAQSRAVAAYAAWMQEASPASIEEIVRSTSWLEERDTRLSISLNYGWLADVAAASGRVLDARVYLSKAIHRARVRDAVGEAMAYRAMASVPWCGHGRTPEQYLSLAMQSAVSRRSPREQAVTLLHQAQHAAGNQQRLEAIQLAERAQSAFTAMRMSWHHALADQCLARLRVGQS
jgi:tetratricopeptide (TPR) repeat protein